jgi:hypothetical protein
VYMRARLYDPITGRFISEDSAKHGNNWHNYCNNNPINHVDPDGREFSAVGQLSVNAIQSGLLFASVTAMFNIMYQLVLTGKINWTSVAENAFGAFILGAGLALIPGQAGATLGSFVTGASLKEFAGIMAKGLGIGTIAGGLAGVLWGFMTHNVRVGILLETLAEDRILGGRL